MLAPLRHHVKATGGEPGHTGHIHSLNGEDRGGGGGVHAPPLNGGGDAGGAGQAGTAAQNAHVGLRADPSLKVVVALIPVLHRVAD